MRTAAVGVEHAVREDAIDSAPRWFIPRREERVHDFVGNCLSLPCTIHTFKPDMLTENRLRDRSRIGIGE